MADATSTETNWLVIGLAVVCVLGFAASFLVGQRRTDTEWIITKYTLRFEAPALGAFLLAYTYYPTNEILIAGILALLALSGIATWFALAEAKDLERQGKLTKHDDTR